VGWGSEQYIFFFLQIRSGLAICQLIPDPSFLAT
jgi:hypothetical protein